MKATVCPSREIASDMPDPTSAILEPAGGSIVNLVGPGGDAWLAGQHLVGERAERIDVGAAVDRSIARCLLGRHVLRCAERKARLRHALTAGLRHGEGDAEVGDDRLTVLEKNVLRLEIAMNDAV